MCVWDSGADWIIFTEGWGVNRLFAWLDRTPPTAATIVMHSRMPFV